MLSIPTFAGALDFPSIANQFVKVSSDTIAYKDEGSGQVLLCLHAVGHSSKDFTSLYELDLGKYRVISLDFPGHGRSSPASEPVCSRYLARVAAAFVDALDLRDVVLVGNSIGGAVALRLAAGNANVRALSLSNPAGLDQRGLLAPLFLAYMVHFFRQGVRHKPSFGKKFEEYYQQVLPSRAADERRREITAGGYDLAPILVQAWTSFQSKDEDLRPLIGSVQCPVLFTWGMKDRFVQYSRNKQAIHQFGRFTLIQYPIGHTPYVECPEAFRADFERFLSSTAL